MSSFRAGLHFGDHDFVPSPIFGVQAAGSSAGENASAFEVGVGFGLSAAKDGSKDAAVEEWTAERIEALEQAAFSRGVESARDSNQNALRVCGILEAAARELVHVSSTTIATNRGLLLGLAMEMARKWVGEELKLDPSLFAKALNRVITSCETTDGATLFLNPSDRAALVEMDEERVSIWLDQYRLDIAEDEDIQLGMFRIEGPGQTIDGTADSICDSLRDELSEAFAADLPEVTS